MIGRAVCDRLSDSGFEVITIGRQRARVKFEVGSDNLSDLKVGEVDFFVNCLGLITQLIDEKNTSHRLEAASINTLFPHELEVYAKSMNTKVIHVTTDCVFSGNSGSYVESSTHDASDIYGLTKSLGEVKSQTVMNIRASSIGREEREFKSLLEWVVRQPVGSEIVGYTDRYWNGVTTLAFARVIAGVISKELFRPGTQHLVPLNVVSKAELLSLISEAFGRRDIKIKNQPSGLQKDLTLATDNPEFNLSLWLAAGYSAIPTIQEMIEDLPG
jgi:dTDP-4-dehydrorhamnose reductase